MYLVWAGRAHTHSIYVYSIAFLLSLPVAVSENQISRTHFSLVVLMELIMIETWKKVSTIVFWKKKSLNIWLRPWSPSELATWANADATHMRLYCAHVYFANPVTLSECQVCCMMMCACWPMWEHIPVLKYVEFNWINVHVPVHAWVSSKVCACMCLCVHTLWQCK